MKIKFKISTEWMETNHRIHEITMGNGQSTFYPQRKMIFLVWRPIIDPDWARPMPRKYNTLAEATNFLRERQTERQMETKSKKIVKTTNHPFNLVFEKLKQPNHE